MPVNKKTKSKRSRHPNNSVLQQRKGVCTMCGAYAYVTKIPEFDDHLLCDSCREDTALLSQYLQSNRHIELGLDDDLFDDEPPI